MASQISARVSEDLDTSIEAYSDENNLSKSEAIRTLLSRGLEYDDLENENTRLRDQLAATNQRIDDVGELVAAVEEERQLERRRIEREERRAKASVLTRAKWWLTGMD